MPRSITKLTVAGLPLLLLAACGGGGSGNSDQNLTPAPVPPPTATSVTISGKITYARVPQKVLNNGAGLDYANTRKDPVRGATVEAVDATDAILATSRTDDTLGTYALTVPVNTNVKIRVKAETVLTGAPAPAYSVKIVDNTNGNAEYALAGTLADSGTQNSTRNLNAPSGWGGSSYISPRSSGPFAILDSIFSATQTVLAADPNVVLSPLTVNWSVNNVPANGDTTLGQIGTSYYNGDSKLYILGAADNDTDEFDGHIILHEWGHYFEDRLSRSDSIGGPHTGGDRLDMRTAFGEGFGNAISGMVTLDPVYRDTSGAQQDDGFNFSVDNNTVNNPGWYSEASVQAILYDLFDSGNEPGIDFVSLGFKPLYEVLTNAQRNTPYFTSIFTFITALKANNPGSSAAIDTLVSGQNIQSATIDPTGSKEINDAGGTANVLPVYTVVTVNGGPVNVCITTTFGVQNKLSNHRFLQFTADAAGNYNFSATRTSGYNPTDPEMIIYRAGTPGATFDSANNNSETGSVTLPAAGLYLIDLFEYNSQESALGTACFNVTVTH